MKHINHALIQEVGKQYGLIEVFRGDLFSFSIRQSAIDKYNRGFACVFVSVTRHFLFACFRIEDQKLVSGMMGMIVDGFDIFVNMGTPHAFTAFQLFNPTQYFISYDLHLFAARRGAKEEDLRAVLDIMESMKGELLRLDVDYPFRHPDEDPSCTTASRMDCILKTHPWTGGLFQ